MHIEYNGNFIETDIWTEVSKKEQEQLQQEYFQKPDFEEVKRQLKKISVDGVMLDKITRYYFKDLMAKVKYQKTKWTVEEVFSSPEVLGIFKAKTLENKKMFPESEKLVNNIATAIRLGGMSYAKMPTNYPLKSVREILSKYNINNNWYDFSCGWGVRLLGALSMKVNYYGTDPNYLLIERLNQLINDYRQIIGINIITDIRALGSEIFIPEWENKMGLAFSSPPYFDLEDYQIGEQSYTPGTTYESWKKNYLEPTIINIDKYLINDGILAINIKNTPKYKLATDAKDIIEHLDFKLQTIELLTNNQRITPSGHIDNNEGIYIFKKESHLIAPSINISTSTLEMPIKNKENPQKADINSITNIQVKSTTAVDTIKKIDIFLIGARSKKQLNDTNLYNSENKFLGERYFTTYYNDFISHFNFLEDYEINKYIEVNKQNVIDILQYAIFHKDCMNSFKSVVKLCEIIESWDEMELKDIHLFLQIENN